MGATETLTQEYNRRVLEVQEDAEAIATATSYTQSYIKHGATCDSSIRSDKRIMFVKEAEREFCEMHKKEILEMAARSCLQTI